jgi:hypothetical protein
MHLQKAGSCAPGTGYVVAIGDKAMLIKAGPG